MEKIHQYLHIGFLTELDEQIQLKVKAVMDAWCTMEQSASFGHASNSSTV